jgi:NADPH-dependent 2,4-dienoyl-CoA reductase/sulfur reductase-like enzyme
MCNVVKRIVIVGGSHAGISTAINLKKALGDEVEVTLLERHNEFEFSFVGADGLLWIQGKLPENKLGYAAPEKIRLSGINLHFECQVQEVDFQKKVVFGLTDNSVQSFAYDFLVLASGSTPATPKWAKTAPIPQSLVNRVCTVKTRADITRIKALSDDPQIKKIAIVGGGYIGIETAEVLNDNQKNVTVFQRSNSILNGYYDQEFTTHLTQLLKTKGIEILFNQEISSYERFENDNFDAVILTTGFKPISDLGLDQIKRLDNAYDVNQFQETSQRDVYAVGDCSVSYHNAFGSKKHIALGSNTRIESYVAAMAIRSKLHQKESQIVNHGTQGSNALSIYGYNLASTGLTLATALKNSATLDISPKMVTFCGTQIAPELSKSRSENEIKLGVVYDSKTMRILGCQVESYGKQVSLVQIFSLAIERGLTVYDLQTLDMYFLPGLNQLYNVISRVLSRVKED